MADNKIPYKNQKFSFMIPYSYYEQLREFTLTEKGIILDTIFKIAISRRENKDYTFHADEIEDRSLRIFLRNFDIMNISAENHYRAAIKKNSEGGKNSHGRKSLKSTELYSTDTDIDAETDIDTETDTERDNGTENDNDIVTVLEIDNSRKEEPWELSDYQQIIASSFPKMSKGHVLNLSSSVFNKFNRDKERIITFLSGELKQGISSFNQIINDLSSLNDSNERPV